MQASLHGQVQARGVLGPFFLATAGISVTALSAMAAPALHRTSRHFSRPLSASLDTTAAQDSSAFAVFQLHGQFQLQLQLQLQLQDFLRTAMFFYRFSCFISLVTNVTKKSLESFWDRKGLCNQFAWVGLGQRGFGAVFFQLQLGFQLQPSAAQAFTAAQDSSAFPLSSDLVTREILVTALVTALVTRFSPNSYVFLQIQLFHLSCN